MLTSKQKWTVATEKQSYLHYDGKNENAKHCSKTASAVSKINWFSLKTRKILIRQHILAFIPSNFFCIYYLSGGYQLIENDCQLQSCLSTNSDLKALSNHVKVTAYGGLSCTNCIKTCSSALIDFCMLHAIHGQSSCIFIISTKSEDNTITCSFTYLLYLKKLWTDWNEILRVSSYGSHLETLVEFRALNS